MTARALAHVGLAAFGLFTLTLNALALGLFVTVIYLVAGAAAGPPPPGSSPDRRKLQPGYYGPQPARGPAWAQPTEPAPPSGSRAARSVVSPPTLEHQPANGSRCGKRCGGWPGDLTPSAIDAA